MRQWWAAMTALVLLAGGLVLSPVRAAGNNGPTGNVAFVGVATCAGSVCHGRSEGNGAVVRQDELLHWQDPASKGGAHSRAYAALTGKRGQQIAATLGLGSAAAAPACLGCHATDAPAALRGPGYPAMLVEGRSYLLMLAPTPELAPRLADPQGRLSMYERLDRGQIVAVVDLSQSAAERASEAVLASRSGTREGVRFDPERWAAARAAPVITAEHAGLARFIGAELLARPGGSVAELRAWLGAPDVQHYCSPSGTRT